MSVEHSKGVQGGAWTNIVVGALVIMTPFFSGDTSAAPLWNSVIAGALVVIMAGYNAYAASSGRTEKAFGPAIMNILVGLYIFFVPFALEVSTTYLTMMLLFGAVIAVAAGYNTWASADARKHEGRMHA